MLKQLKIQNQSTKNIKNNTYVTETLVTHKNSIIEVVKKEVAIT